MQDGMKQYFTRGRRRRAWQKVVRAMACIVVFCTVYALILPAITMEQDLSCSLEEHTHADSCYTQVTVVEQSALRCSKSALNLHTHTAQCYTEGEVRCGYSDFAVHSHSPLCRDGEGNLVCDLPVIPEHTHTDACYEIRLPEAHTHSPECYALALVCPHAHEDACYAAGGAPACGLQETAGHTHGADCMESTLTCEEAAEGHVHEAACYQQSLVCAQEEAAAHSHESDCYSPELACPHTHEESCYLRTEELVCGKEEAVGTEEPLPERVLVCSLAEVKLHTHGDGCFDANGALVCPLQQVLSHVHGEDCVQTQETAADTQSLTCGLEEAEDHTHSPRCYGQWDLTCALEEHAHTELCYAQNEVPEETEAPGEEEAEGETTQPEDEVESPVELPADSQDAMLLAELPPEYVVKPTPIEGTNVTWAVTTDDTGAYTLRFDGEGAIPDYAQNDVKPWQEYKNTSLKLVFGDGITEVGEYAFERDFSIREIDWGGVHTIARSAFRYVRGNNMVLTIPGTVKTIENSAFEYSVNIKALVLEEGVETIGKWAFHFQLLAMPTHIPASIREIGALAFNATTEYTVSEQNEHFCAVDGVLYTKDMTELVDFPGQKIALEYRVPDTVKIIREDALSYVKYVKKLYVPGTVETVVNRLAQNTNYEEIYLADGFDFTNSGLWFYLSAGLRTIRFPENTPISINGLFYNVTTNPNLETFKIPNGTTNLSAMGADGISFPSLREVTYDAADAIINKTSTTYIFGSNAYFDLIVGPSVDKLPANFRYLSEKSTSLRFQGENTFQVEAGAFTGTGAPLETLSGSCYVDAQGVLYSFDSQSNTAKVVYCSPGLEAMTIPASIKPDDGKEYAVTAVGTDALLRADSLQSITFASPGTILQMESFCLANCPTLTSVNGETSVEAVQRLFTNENAELGYSICYNTGLQGSVGSMDMDGNKDLVVQESAGRNMTIALRSSGKTMEWVEGEGGKGGYRLLTGDTLTATASVGNTNGDENSVYRVYFRLTSAEGSLDVKPGHTYTFDGQTAICHATEEPYTYYMEFTPSVGATVNIPVTATYPSPNSSGGGLNIWGEILTKEEAQQKAERVVQTDTGLKLQWATKPDTFRLSKTPGRASISIVSNEKGGGKPGNTLLWNIKLERDQETVSAYGKDYAVAVKFTDILTLPEGMDWDPDILQAIKAGRAMRNVQNIYADGKRLVSVSISGSNPPLRDAALYWDETLQKVVLTIELYKRAADVEMNASDVSVHFFADAFAIDMEKIQVNTEYTIENDVTASVQYSYSENRELTASASTVIKGGEADMRVKKSSSGVKYFGEDVTYTVTLINNGAVPYVASRPFGANVVDTLSEYSYIKPENMERMFAESPELVIQIENAILAPWEQVTGVDGTIAWKNSGNSDLGTGPHTLQILRTEDGRYKVLVKDGQEYTADTVAQALQTAGYAVTGQAKYTCTWKLCDEDAIFTWDNTQQREFPIYATLKDSFRRITADWPNEYPTPQPIDVTNRATLHIAEAARAANVTDKVRREADVHKNAYIGNDIQYDGSNVVDGTILNWHLDFSHRGTGAYEDLPMVDDIYGSQNLLVPVADNPGLQGRNLPAHTEGGVEYYILTEGTYENVKVGVDDTGTLLNAASITVTKATDEVQIGLGGQNYKYTGLHTKIKWYFPEQPGRDYQLQVKYKTLVDLDNSGPTYTIGNIVWMNDRRDTRIYDPIWGGGTIIDYEKHIVTGQGTTPAEDVLEKYSKIEEGDAVLYRMTLHNTNNTPFLLTGENLADALPSTYGLFAWAKGGNVSFEGYRTEGEGITLSGLENWSIADSYAGLSGDNQQYIVWPAETQVLFTQESTLYLYFTLTFPENGEVDLWSQYEAASRGMPVNNTLLVYRFPSSVTHDLKEPGQVLLQKGVYGMYHFNVSYDYTKSGNSRLYYNNRDIRKRGVLYYITVYNGGGKRLYLDTIYDQLPEGFTYKHQLRADSNLESAHVGTVTDQIFTNGGITLGDNPLVDFGISGISYRNASIRAITDDSGGLSFTVGAGTGDYAVKYDEKRDKYYLDYGEAIVFGYVCEIGLAAETRDSATNAVQMAYDDYLDTGLNVITKENLPIKATNSDIFLDNNDGTRDSITETDGQKWLASEVTVIRGGIIPGVTKYTDSYFSGENKTATPYVNFVNPTDTVNWRIRLHNAGTLSLVDYTFTDIMPAPYVFEGKVSFQYYDARGNLLAEQPIVTIPKRQENYETSLAVTTGNGKTVTVPLNGTWANIDANSPGALRMSMGRDEMGNEMLRIDCEAFNMAIMEGGYVDVILSSRNPTSVHENKVYTNQAALAPNVQPFDNVSHGSMVRDESGKPEAVGNYSPVNVTFGFATSSQKQVAEVSRPENAAVSTDPANNRIILQNDASSFVYTLTVSNDTEHAMTKLVLIDNLPQPGDKTLFDDPADRNSGFTVNLAPEPAFTVTVTPLNGEPRILSDTQYSLEYSTEADFGGSQSPDWQGAATGKWTQTRTDARAFRLMILDPDGTLIPSESTVSLSFMAVAGADAEAGEIAWNSFGYHYGLKSVSAELEAMPLTVGVSIPGVPTLDKQLLDKEGAPAPAKEETSFDFLIYTGDALPGNYDSEAALTAALTEAERTWKKVTLTVPKGSSRSQEYKLKLEDWTWQTGQVYTVVELPTPEEYEFLRFEGTNSESYTFRYDPSVNQSIRCVNRYLPWTVEVTKTDIDGEFLSGAVFGLYSPLREAQMPSIPAEYGPLEIPMTLEQAGSTWYLTALAETDETGKLRFADLLQDAYYLREVKAPDGYMLPTEVWKLTRQGSTDGVYTQRIVNYAVYELPDTGGAGRNQYVLGGILLTVLALAYIYLKRRGEANASP